MFRQATLDTAADTVWDIVIAGSSFSAMFFLYGLPKGLRVLIIEKGDFVDHEGWNAAASDRDRYRDFVEIENFSDIDKDFVANTLFGGNSNCWTGQIPRFHPNDFRSHELYGIGAPWGVTYEELEPFYVDVETMMEAAGGGTDHLLPRSAPFPYPPHEVSRSDRLAIEAFPELWAPSPSARSNGGSRPSCCGNVRCRNCPIDAKYTILNGLDAFVRDEVTLVTGGEVREVDIEGGTASALIVRDKGGALHRIRARVSVALATNALFNAAILLRSGLTHPALGRYLGEQAGLFLNYDIDVPGLFGGTLVPTLGWAFYDGPFRREVASTLIESINISKKLRPEKGLWTHTAYLKIIADDVPNPESRVILDETGEPRMIWQGHSDYAFRGIEKAEAALQDVLPFQLERETDRKWAVTEAHIQGTHRMGPDAATSVVDDTQRVHGIDRLFALGAGSFPTITAANPTLTLSALALRSGRTL